MSTTALSLVKDWLMSHPTATALMISRELQMSIIESRQLLGQAVETLGSDQFRVTYVGREIDADGNWRIILLKNNDGRGMLHSVQRKTDFSSSVFTVEQKIKRLRIEDAASTNELYHDFTANIPPLKQSVRNVFNSQRNTHPAAIKEAPLPFKKEPALQVKKEAPIKQEVALQSKKPASEFFKPAPITKSSIEIDHITSKVRFETSSKDKASLVKRISTPHPVKSVGKVESLEDIMKSDLYSVEEDDPMDIEPLPEPLKRKHSPDTTSHKRAKLDPEVSVGDEENAPSVGFKIVRKKKTRTYKDDKGRLVTEDYIDEEQEEVLHKPVSDKPTVVKKATQTSMRAFFK